MNYQVIIDKNASKVIDKLEKPLQSAIRKAIKQLRIEPRPFGYKKLVDANGLYRIKVKNYRIIYARPRQFVNGFSCQNCQTE